MFALTVRLAQKWPDRTWADSTGSQPRVPPLITSSRPEPCGVAVSVGPTSEPQRLELAHPGAHTHVNAESCLSAHRSALRVGERVGRKLL